MAELGLGQIMFELCPICVVVRWVAIGKSIKQYRIKRQSPIRRRRIERVILPFTPIVDWNTSCPISVYVMCDLRRVVLERATWRCKEKHDR